MTSVTTLQERLRLVRESLNETQKSLSLRLGMSVGTWPNYETGKTSPDFKTLEALVKLGFSAHWLITGEGEMRKEGEENAPKPVPTPVSKEIQTVEGYPPFVPIIVKSKAHATPAGVSGSSMQGVSMIRTIKGTWGRCEEKYILISECYTFPQDTYVCTINQVCFPSVTCFISKDIVPERTSCI